VVFFLLVGKTVRYVVLTAITLQGLSWWN